MNTQAAKPILACFSALCLCAVGCGGTKSDADFAQGTWTVVAGSDNAKAFPAAEKRQGKVVVEGDRFTMHEVPVGDPQTWNWTWSFHLDPAQNPKRIEFTVGDKRAPGIYQFDAEHWKLAVAVPGHPRPADFEPAGSTLVLELKPGGQ